MWGIAKNKEHRGSVRASRSHSGFESRPLQYEFSSVLPGKEDTWTLDGNSTQKHSVDLPVWIKFIA